MRLAGKVALITGAARGQGRAHALRLAQEGADLVLLDRAEDLPGLSYHLASTSDFEETVAAAEALGRRVVHAQVDVRDGDGVAAAVEQGLEQLGRLDVVVANAGISPRLARSWEITTQEWDDVLAVNLTGVWNTIRAVVPPMIESRGGAIVLTSSGAGLKGIPHLAAYNASKHGVIGLAMTLANELARYDIRVNAVCPGSVGTPMITENEAQLGLFRPDLENPTLEDAKPVFARAAPLGRPWIEPEDVAEAVLYLVADSGRYVTGIVLPVDQGAANR